MRVLTVIGNRPQFVKAAAVSGPLRAGAEELLVHTGQHHDDELSRVFFDQLALPAPDRWLNIAGGTNTDQTARMLAALGPLLADERPDAVLVYGDTNSTLAGALAAAQARVPVAHVEAGMRSFDRAMPEELNRVLSDHASDLLLCPTQTAVDNLIREGIADGVELVGDVMVDVAERIAERARADTEPLAAAGVEPGAYVLATLHRAGTVDDPRRLATAVDLLAGLGRPVVLPLHPRTRARLDEFGLADRLAAAADVRVTAPLGPLEFAALLHAAAAVVTDSGGVQKEAYLAAVPCVTLRDRTEWVETVATGWNVIADLDAARVAEALAAPRPPEHPPLFGDGHAGERVADAVRVRLPALRARGATGPSVG